MAYARAAGAERIVLVGASLGALATLKVAGDAAAVVGAVIVSAPLGPIEGLTMHATLEDVRAIRVPLLFITSEDDAEGFADDVQRMYAAATAHKDLAVFPGRAHGTDMLVGPNGAGMTARIVRFVRDVSEGAR